MSESLTWLDHIIFAMAPLGILTAIVGAIRVSGPAWARAFIGRARESRAAAEIELMSSTSREVCEVYNGKGVVRAMGTPKITQFILFPAEYRTDQGTCGIHTLETAYVREQPFLERGKYGVKTDWDAFKEEYVHDVGTGIALGAGLAMGSGTNIRVDLDDNNIAGKTEAQNDKGSALVGLEERTPGARRRGFWSKPKPEDVENPRALKVSVHREDQPQDEKDEKNRRRARQPTFPPEMEGSAPNLQLNLPSTIPSHKSTIKDLWIAAVVASLVQVSVLVVSAVTTFHTFRAVVRPQTNYGFWLFIAGTLCLDSGMILCSFVIEQSTQESSWRMASSKNYRKPGMETNAVGTSASVIFESTEVGNMTVHGPKGTVQPKVPTSTKVNTVSQSKRFSASDQSNILTESEKPRNTTPLQLFWLQQKHTVNDQDFEPFLILGGHKSKILTSSRRLDYDSWKFTGTIRRIPVPKWAGKIAEKRYEFLAVSASLLGLLGFMMQFEGLRGLNWPTAVSQLLAILAVALIRAIVRRHLGEGPSAIRAHAGHELDCMLISSSRKPEMYWK